MLNRLLMACFLVAGGAWAQTSQQDIDRVTDLMKSGDNAGAAAILQGVVDRDPKNVKALEALAAATFVMANNTKDPIDRNRKMDDVAVVLKRAIEVKPTDDGAYYMLGVVAWNKTFPELQSARTRIGMRPQDPGPLTDFNTRQEMRARLEPGIEEGIANLQKALEINSKNADAMAYLNLLIRSHADIRDTPGQAAEDRRTADGWVQKSMAAKGGQGTSLGLLAPPPPPPPAPAMAAVPGSIRVGGNVAAASLIVNVHPDYPPLALQARIQGTVRFNVTIGKDGHIENLTLVSGHPLLVAAAQTAVQQWVYRPTLLNGNPVQVITTADVNFTLNQ
jgi:TonB family protein